MIVRLATFVAVLTAVSVIPRPAAASVQVGDQIVFSHGPGSPGRSQVNLPPERFGGAREIATNQPVHTQRAFLGRARDPRDQKGLGAYFVLGALGNRG